MVIIEPRPTPSEPERKTGEKSKSVRVEDSLNAIVALEAGGISTWRWDISSDTFSHSKNFEALHGIPPGTMDGTLSGFEAIIHGEDQPRFRASLATAIENQTPYAVRYRISSPSGTEERWLESRGTVDGSESSAALVLGVSQDVSRHVKLEQELRSRAKQQAALAQLGERALVEQEIDLLLNDAVSTVALTLGVDLVKILELLPGDPQLLMRAGFGWNLGHGAAVPTLADLGEYGRYVLESPGPVVIAEFTAETRFSVPAYISEAKCISGVSTRVAGRDEQAYGILDVCTFQKRAFDQQDISFIAAVSNLLAGAIQRRQLERRNELMIREMRHRTGNLFSQLLALFSQTAKNSKNIADLSTKYQARVLALANAHRLITEGGWNSLPIEDVLHQVLGAYLDRTSFQGPSVDLEPDPIFHLSAALHELVANAVKHGSLSRAKGQLELSWSISRMRRGMTLSLDWVEKNGPPARRPQRLGFGSRLISLVIERQLNGEVTRTFARSGLIVHMVVPLTRERWPSAPPAEQPAETLS